MIFTNFGRAMISVKRVNEILNYEVKIVDGEVSSSETEIKGVVEFNNVSFAYPKSKEAVLNNLSFKINQGETVAIVGATGCGKSTLVNLMVRFYDTTEGEVLIDGINVKEYKLQTLRDKIAIVLQKSELFNISIKENISWGNPEASYEEIVEAAQIAQAHSYIVDKPNGYDEVVEQKGSSLSGGQKQRLSIARAIVKNPEILIFDDSTSALDLVTEAKLYNSLNEKFSHVTKIIVAQRIATVKNADRIIVLDNAKIVAFDTHENLMKNSEVYIDIYNSQLKREGEFDE
jgi:ATP-binding cassette subfamily B protein